MSAVLLERPAAAPPPPLATAVHPPLGLLDWNARFEDDLFVRIANRHQPGFPAQRAAPPRPPQGREEELAIAAYWTRVAAHDTFIVQAASHAVAHLFSDIDLQHVLARQIGDDAFHADVARKRVWEITGSDPLPAVTRHVAEYWERLGDLPIRSVSGFAAFEFHLEVYILPKLQLTRRTGARADLALSDFSHERAIPDEEYHRVKFIDWWQRHLAGLAPGERESLVDQVIADDDEFQRRHAAYLRPSYEQVRESFGTDITHGPAIYDDWRRETLARLTGRPLQSLDGLVRFND